jgi:Xaa-Pro dipeptidase
LIGEGASAAHLTWTDEKFNNNEVTILETAGCHRRYHCPLCRTIYLGNPPDKLNEIAKASVEALEVALDCIKPGLTCEEVEAKWWKAIGGSDVMKEPHRLGYSMGVGYPPDWGEHTASMRPGDKTVLKPNMTFHLIPSIWEKDYGFGVSETLRVTADGCATFANFPRMLFVK